MEVQGKHSSFMSSAHILLDFNINVGEGEKQVKRHETMWTLMVWIKDSNNDECVNEWMMFYDSSFWERNWESQIQNGNILSKCSFYTEGFFLYLTVLIGLDSRQHSCHQIPRLESVATNVSKCLSVISEAYLGRQSIQSQNSISTNRK